MGSKDNRPKYTLVYKGTVCEDVPSMTCSYLMSGETSLEERLGQLRCSSSAASSADSSRYMLASSLSTCTSGTSTGSCCSQSLVSNDYLYTDTDEDITLIERHYPASVASTSLSQDLHTSTDISSSVSYRSVQIPSSLAGIDDSALRHMLSQYGDAVGPITPSTRKVYLMRLMQWRQQEGGMGDMKPINVHKPSHDFSPELHRVLEQGLSILKNDKKFVTDYERRLFGEFDNPHPDAKLREGTAKTSFNYLLLDPRVTMNLPNRAGALSEDDLFYFFIHGIFYIGKGKQERPYAHFYDAIKIKAVAPTKNAHPQRQTSDKLSKILDIWASGQGVVSLHVNHNIIPVEAYSREAAMIDAVSIKRLTNVQKGNYYGSVMSSMNNSEKRWFGSHLLYRALTVLLADGERQIRPHNL